MRDRLGGVHHDGCAAMKRMARPTRAFGAIKRGIGISQKLIEVRAVRVGGDCRDPDGGRDLAKLPPIADRHFASGDQTRGDPAKIFGLGAVADQHDEFIATDTGSHITQA